MPTSLIHSDTEDSFVQQGALFLAEQMVGSIEARGRCVVGLSGGKTPLPIYRALREAKNLDWSCVTIFLTDERYVPTNHPESTQRIIRELLPEGACIAPDTSLPLDVCLRDYAERLEQVTGGPADLMVLGIGEDGHIASLFPPLPEEALAGSATVIHTTTDTFAVHDRISLSLPALCDARQFVFFLAGEKKQKTWEEMEESAEDERRWPAKRILAQGNCTVFIATPPPGSDR